MRVATAGARERVVRDLRNLRNLRDLRVFFRIVEITQKSTITGLNGWLTGFAGSPKMTHYVTGD